jgi:hypothetical protein
LVSNMECSWAFRAPVFFIDLDVYPFRPPVLFRPRCLSIRTVSVCPRGSRSHIPPAPLSPRYRVQHCGSRACVACTCGLEQRHAVHQTSAAVRRARSAPLKSQKRVKKDQIRVIIGSIKVAPRRLVCGVRRGKRSPFGGLSRRRRRGRGVAERVLAAAGGVSVRRRAGRARPADGARAGSRRRRRRRRPGPRVAFAAGARRFAGGRLFPPIGLYCPI